MWTGSAHGDGVACGQVVYGKNALLSLADSFLGSFCLTGTESPRQHSFLFCEKTVTRQKPTI